MDDLGSPRDWQLKGEGNANLVFAYTGSDPRLVGRVLRVRKPRPPLPPEQAALEDAVWAPVLGPLAAGQLGAASANSSAGLQPRQQDEPIAAEPLVAAAAAAAQREQLYVQRVLAPLLGRHHIPPQQPMRPSPAFLQQLLSGSAACGSSDAQAAPTAGTAALLPDVTLLPQCTAAAPLAPWQEQQAQQQAAQQQQTPGQPVGPVVCIELKPKCGFVASCGTVHPANRELKHSRSRYRLHQLLKLSQGKISACSAYDPCDLFSGDPARLRCALSALLQQPQNNLLLFVDGRRQELAGQQRRKGRKQQAQQQQQAQQAQQQAQQLEQQQEQQAQQAQQQAQQLEQQQEQQGAASLEQLLGGLLPLPPEQRQGALAELLDAVLEQEGVLPRLLRTQQQCTYDVEGIYRLYCQLAGLQPEEATACAAEGGGSGGNGSGTRSSSSGSGDGGDSNEYVGGNGSGNADSIAAHAAAVAQLLALPEAEAHAVLRSYVVSSTAKDCALMVALQRLDGPPPEAAAAAAAGDRSAAAAAGTAAGAPAGGGAACGTDAAMQQSFEERQQCWDVVPACLFCPALGGELLQAGSSGGQERDASGSCGWGGGWFRYRLCFVDLDLKPLAKIPAHAELDRRIIEAAKRHLGAAAGTAGVP